MAHATFVKSAQKTIYENGKYVKYKSKKGKNKGKMLEKLDRTIPENKKDKVFIKKGESYWWWAFKNGGKRLSKTKPKASQLTQSAYLGTLYDLQDQINGLGAGSPDDLRSEVEDIISSLEELRDEQEEKKSNMPDSLQESPTAELLQERYDALDNAINELEGIDFDYEEPEDSEENKEDALNEWLAEKINEIQSVSFD